MAEQKSPGVAKVDYLVGEQGGRIAVPEDSTVRATGSSERAIGATGPSTWWRTGLIGIGAVALVLLVLQIFNGGANTDVIPGTPVVESTQP